MNWEDHLIWCRRRALEYLDAGDLENAVASMASDIQKHPETAIKQPLLDMLCLVAMRAVIAHDAREVRRWINGFH